MMAVSGGKIFVSRGKGKGKMNIVNCILLRILYCVVICCLLFVICYLLLVVCFCCAEVLFLLLNHLLLLPASLLFSNYSDHERHALMLEKFIFLQSLISLSHLSLLFPSPSSFASLSSFSLVASFPPALPSPSLCSLVLNLVPLFLGK